MRTHGVAFPESELRNLFVSKPDGTMGRSTIAKSVRDAIFAGRQKPDYARIRVPVLALFAFGRSLEDQTERYKPQDAEERSAMEHVYASNLAIRQKHMRDFRSRVTSARVIELHGVNYYRSGPQK